MCLSPDIQNEIINIIGNQIRTSIVESCNNSKFFTLIADETTNTSTREQVSVCLRYLERDPISNKISIKEDFLDFVMATSTTGEHLAELLIETLNNAGINTMNMRAQGYDGAANMSGKYNGVQARILQIVPGAMYVHCKSHCLNLAIVHSCKDTSVRNVMSTVQEVAFSFDYSSKKLQAFYQELDSDATTKENMDKRTKLRTLCETRWTSRADALYTFKTSFPVVVHALERLQGLGDDKAGQYLASITRFEFVIALVVSEHILQSTVYLSKFLQGIECDLLEATKECKTVIELLRAERLDESVWDELYQSALDLSEPFDIVENMPRRCGRQTTRANQPADTPKQYWKVSLYIAFIDHMIMELESRLIKSENRFFAQYLLPRVIGNITNEQIATLYETYQTDLTCNLDEFKREVVRWRTRWSITPRDQMPTSLCETLDAVNPVLYPSIDTILCIMLTMPVTSATAERSFSVLRRLKTYVRSTMKNDRLSSLALTHIHRDFSVDLDKIMEKFVSAKTRRTDFGQF